MKTIGYAAQAAKSPLAPFHFDWRDLRPDDVAFEVLYCGICHSDLHQAKDTWGMDQVDEAFERLERGEIAHRFVIDMASLEAE